MNELNTDCRKQDGFDNERVLVIPRNIVKNYVHNPLVSMLYITDIGYYPCARNHFRRRATGSEQIILIYCNDGEGWYDIGKGRVTVKKHDFFLIDANTPHAYGASERHPWSIYWVHFSGTQSVRFSDLLNRINHLNDSDSSRFEERIVLFDEMMANLEMGYSNEILEYVTICLFHFLGSFRYVPHFVNHSRNAGMTEK
jgi:AraC-like ligand binding domain.